MRVEIEGEAEVILRRLAQPGVFDTAEAVLEHALRLADAEAEKLALLRAAVRAALDEPEEDRGTFDDLDRELEEVFAELEAEFKVSEDHA